MFAPAFVHWIEQPGSPGTTRQKSGGLGHVRTSRDASADQRKRRWTVWQARKQRFEFF